MAQPTWFHLSAKLSPGMPELSTQETGEWLWPRMREAFPTSIASTLMPSHPHCMPATSDPDGACERLARLLGQLGRRHGVMGRASLVSARAVEGVEALRRNVRYVALNPCRASLVRCPLAWPWSTHRDVMGTCVDPWVTADRLAMAFGRSSAGFAEWYHRYVSADPSTVVDGTALPIAAMPRPLVAVPLQWIADAVLSATRTGPAALRARGFPRALFFALAFDQGWTQTDRLAEIGQCRRRLVRQLVPTVSPETLAVARLCLGDARLRTLPTPIPRTDHRMPFRRP